MINTNIQNMSSSVLIPKSSTAIFVLKISKIIIMTASISVENITHASIATPSLTFFSLSSGLINFAPFHNLFIKLLTLIKL